MDTTDYIFRHYPKNYWMRYESIFTFGMGIPEIVYKRALMIKLRAIGLMFEFEVEKEILYQGQLITKRRLD